MVLWVVVLLFAIPAGAQQVLSLLSVCEVQTNVAAWEGKPIAIAGRYSLRGRAIWLGQEHCPGESATKMRLVLDDARAPHLPDQAVMDEHAAEQKLKQIRATTTLGKFHFGSPDYDRWAIVFGMVERSKDGLLLVFRGDGVVFFYAEP